jgi:hypothetical protein
MQFVTFTHFSAALAVMLPLALAAPARAATGEAIYKNLCASCHGSQGQGVADKHDEPLSGDKSLEAIARVITRTMPEDEPEKCTGEDAEKVAAYIFEAFYSPAARARNNPPRVQLSRLTNRQYENAIADLAASFTDAQPQNFVPGGLSAEYFSGRRFRDEQKAIERTDPQIDFDFGQETPDAEKITTNEFAIRWRGSIKAEETGYYEFSITTENGARVWLNNDRAPFIDAWVSSGTEPREHRETIRLLGGRAYPIRVEFFRFSEKSASLKLQWKPPHRVWEVIPERNLATRGVRETLVVTTPFPADDSSTGYERGISVSKAWEQATTHAAVEIAGKIADQFATFSGVKNEASDRPKKLQAFCEKFAERAFRRPLDKEAKTLYIIKQFNEAPDADAAVKRSLLLILKSPRYLYPEIPDASSDGHDVAARLSFALWDSLPDEPLLLAAAEGKLASPEEINAQAERMLKSPKTKAKLNAFFHHWLEMGEGEDMSKDQQAFPDFSDSLLADLRASLEMFIHQIVWSAASDYRQLLLADYLFLNERLSKFYGFGSVKSDRFVKVPVDGKQRAGVITHPYLLSTFAYHKNSSPIHRGVFLTRNIVGRALKPPPMAIQFMDGRFDPTLTMREKVTELTAPDNCQTCHSVINPLGFSLENFDGVGRFREIDNDKPVDAVSDYLEAGGKIVRFTGARDVAEYAANSPEAQASFIQQMFHHLVKQPAGAYGPETVENLRAAFVKSKFNIQKLMVEIVKVAALRPGIENQEKDTLARKEN